MVIDTTPRVLIHNLPGTALPVDVQLLLLSVLGEEGVVGEEAWKRLPNCELNERTRRFFRRFCFFELLLSPP